GAGIAQGGGGAHQGNDRQRAEAHVHGQGYIDGSNDRHGGEGRADAQGDQQAHHQHQQGSQRLVVTNVLHRGGYHGLDMTGGLHHRGKTVGGNHDEADHGHHLHALGEEVIGLAPAHHTGHGKHDEAG